MTQSSERHFSVWLHNRLAGTLGVRDDYTWFVFDEEYRRDPGRAVLGLRFEQDLNARHSAQMRLPPWFSNLLPEGRLREWIAQERGVPIAREMEILAQVGHDLPGAVRVLAAGEVPRMETPAREIAATGAAERAVSAAWRFSLAGVQLKFSMLGHADRFTAPAGGEGGDWIVKLPDPVFPHVTLNEFAMMRLARAAGIQVPDTRLVHRDAIEGLPASAWPHDEAYAFAVSRFDRAPSGERIHIEDLAQVRGFYPGEEKYAGSFETVAALIYRGHDLGSLHEFVRRLAFNVMIRNGDAHLKNWSLIYRDQRVPELSPAYDLVATGVYRPDSEPENLGLKFGGTRRFERITLSTFARLQERLGVERSPAFGDLVMDVAKRTVAEWPGVRSHLQATGFASSIERTIAETALVFQRG